MYFQIYYSLCPEHREIFQCLSGITGTIDVALIKETPYQSEIHS